MWGFCVWHQLKRELSELTSVVTERSRPVSTLLWHLGESGVLRGPDAFPHRELPEPQSAADFVPAVCQGHEDELGLLLSGGRHRVR